MRNDAKLGIAAATLTLAAVLVWWVVRGDGEADESAHAVAGSRAPSAIPGRVAPSRPAPRDVFLRGGTELVTGQDRAPLADGEPPPPDSGAPPAPAQDPDPVTDPPGSPKTVLESDPVPEAVPEPEPIPEPAAAVSEPPEVVPEEAPEEDAAPEASALNLPCRFQLILEGRFQGVDEVRLRDAQGRELPIGLADGAVASSALFPAGRSGPLRASDRARVLVLLRDGDRVARLPLRLWPSERVRTIRL